MKSILSVAVLLLSLSSFAADGSESKIYCGANSDSDQLLMLTTEVVDLQTGAVTVTGASFYNIGWSQTPETTYQPVVGRGTLDAIAPFFTLILQDGSTMDIDYSILADKEHKGRIVHNDDFYHCY